MTRHCNLLEGAGHFIYLDFCSLLFVVFSTESICESYGEKLVKRDFSSQGKTTFISILEERQGWN